MTRWNNAKNKTAEFPMKILWFTNTASNYRKNGDYNGGGWISSLESELKGKAGISLGISFILDGQPFKVQDNEITYYPIPCKQISGFRVHYYSLTGTFDKIDNMIVEKCMDIINDFKPDIIHIFGSEGVFGLIAKRTKIPIIIHIQGIVQPILNAYLPPMMSWKDYYFSDKNPKNIIKRISLHSRWNHNSKREHEIFKHIHYYCGRTLWDKELSDQMSPNRKYYQINEILRTPFYETSEHRFPQRLTLVSIISDIPFKGMDVILKTAKILREEYKTDMEWLVFGIDESRCFERLTNIRCKDVGVKLCGVADAQKLRETLLNATAFLSLSYIDNSPNSLCEAQILGCPVIATYVGGKSSLVEHNLNGYLVPANSPYITACTIMQIFKNPHISHAISDAGKKIAIERHDRKRTISQLLDMYNDIVFQKVKPSIEE